MEKKVVELFAGVGGFRKGLEDTGLGFNTVWANQWEPGKKVQYAFKCYLHNFEDKTPINDWSNVDIEIVPKDSIPNHNLLVGGFPCQDYSVASTGAKGISGKKGVLWWQIYEILKEKKPPFVLLENVDRLLKSPSSQRGRDFGVMLACFNSEGYIVQWRVINAADYGYAQRRRRIFIFAAKKDTKYAEELVKNSWETIVFKAGFFSNIFRVESNNENTLSNTIIDEIAKVSDFFKFDFKNSGCMANGEIYTSEVIPRKAEYSKKLSDILITTDDNSYYIKDNDSNKELDDWKKMKGPKEIPRTSKTGHQYIFREGGIAFPDPSDRPARTMLTSEGSKNRSTHIVIDPGTRKIRKLTPEECELINGFPLGWTDTGMTKSFRYFCMGNALVVPLITDMGKYIHKIMERE